MARTPATQYPLPEPWHRRLLVPAYSMSSAARFCEVHPQRLAHWFYGRRTGTPTLPGKERGVGLSYYQLVEAAFVATMRGLGVSLPKLRRAHEFWSAALESEFPFAKYAFKTDGKGLLFDLQQIEPDNELERLVVMDKSGQVVWVDELMTRFEEFNYEHMIATQWFVAGRSSKVLIDPRVSFGAPSVDGIPTWALKGRYLAGETVPEIQDDLGLSKEDVIEGLGFEGIAA